jgi:hypothetical protein
MDFLQVLSPFYSSIKRRKSSPELPKYMSDLDASTSEKAQQRELMVTPLFEASVLAYLLNTEGACWRDAQEAARHDKKATAVEEVPSDIAAPKIKPVAIYTRCTWAQDKINGLKLLKDTRKDWYKIALAREVMWAPPPMKEVYNKAKTLLEADEPYKARLRDYMADALQADASAVVTAVFADDFV